MYTYAVFYSGRPATTRNVGTRTSMTFQNLILSLQSYWAEQGCVLMQPYDMEVGAGTFHPPLFYGPLARRTGRQLMFNPAADQQMAGTAKIPTGTSTTTNFRWR